jgi:hypothetical protein
MYVKNCLDILELIARYAHSYDSNDIEEHFSLTMHARTPHSQIASYIKKEEI